MASSLRHSKRSGPLGLALALLLTSAGPGPVFVPAAHAQVPGDNRNALPSLGDSVSADVSVSAERRLGDRIMRDIRRDPDYLDDPVLLDYLQEMWAELIDASAARGNLPAELKERFAWELFLVRDRTVNAFALPGGYVGVHLGLIAMTVAPAELASVLAHELSHVTQRHIARSFGAGKQATLVGLAGLILGVLAASRSPEAANALITGGQAVSAQGQLNFSRDMEREADRVGFNVLTGAGYAPGGMASMFEKLAQASRLNDSQNFPYLRTHPLGSERIGEARSRLGVEAGAPVPRPLMYALMQARARVLMDTREAALQRVQEFGSARAVSDAATPADKLGALYSGALASILRRDFGRAETALAQARPLVADDPAAARVLDLLALQNLIARGDAAGATAALDALRRLPGAGDSRALMLAQAQAALLPAATDAERSAAAGRLQTWVAVRRDDALAWG
ncbi:M48 family metalloprotease, partial [Methylibium sp.]|uniref:M48 family metalloprotease n=1 Tax=Methylibium sp. TaxID=2067992 RepID=UPI00179EDB3E